MTVVSWCLYHVRNYDLPLSLFGDYSWFMAMCMGAMLTRGGLMMVNFLC